LKKKHENFFGQKKQQHKQREAIKKSTLKGLVLYYKYRYIQTITLIIKRLKKALRLHHILKA
jgi:hypothetical protein